jgi:hypothetical protein
MTSADVAGFLSFGIKDNIDKRLQKESILLYKAGALLCYVYILKCYTNQPIIESMINTTQSLCAASPDRPPQMTKKHKINSEPQEKPDCDRSILAPRQS